MVDVRQLIGSNLRRQRLALGLSQEEVAERMGVDRSYVSSLEAGKRNPTIVTAWHAAQAVGVEVKALFEDVSSEEAPFAPRRRAQRVKRG